MWQCTDLALLDVSIQVLTTLTLPASSPWIRLGVGLHLFIIGTLRSRLTEFLSKLYAYGLILITSYADKKQRRRSSLRLVLLNIVALPISLSLLALAAGLSAPLLPLFTLPLLLVGFPRPAKFWPTAVGASESKCDDTVIYR